MDNMYAILYSSIYIYDAKYIKLGRFKRTITSERHVGQSTLEVWYYGKLDDCIQWLTNLYNQMKKDKYKDIECTYDSANNLIRYNWVDNLNTYKYDQLKSLYISKLQNIFESEDDISEN